MVRVFSDDNNDGDYNDADEEKAPILFGDGPISTSKSIQIPAELKTYKFSLSHSSGQWLSREYIVVGDAYYIQGQSNAEAKPVVGTDINIANDEANAQGSIPGNGGARRFIRVYGGGAGTRWRIGDANKDYNSDGNLGQFGMRLGDRLVREEGIPVCIMNGAELGHPISYFQKNSLAVDGNGLNNYTRELNRLIAARLKDHIKAVIWFQGESNTYNGANGELLTASGYTSAFLQLANNWDTDLGIANKFYIVQIRPGCFDFGPGGETASSVLAIQDAQRQLDQIDSRISIISTNNLPKYTMDNCHYYYLSGYKKIGDRVFTLINKDFYNPTASTTDLLTPFPTTVEFSERVGLTLEATQVALHFSQPFDNYTIVGDIRGNFKLEGGSYNITTASIVTDPNTAEKYLTLDFTKNSGTTTNPTGLTYFSNASGLSTTPALANDDGNGIGLISFSNLPLGIGILPVDPLNLRISANTGANNLHWEADNNPQFNYFIVERGDNGSTFTEIAKVTANSASGLGNYEFTDSKPNTIRNYYRIKAFKKDGKSLYSQVVAVNNRTSSAIGITVYPNPVTDRANVGVKVKKAGAATIQIYDGAGKMVSTRKINLQKGNNMFSAGEILDQSAGIYTIRVVTEEEVFNARIVRVK